MSVMKSFTYVGSSDSYETDFRDAQNCELIKVMCSSSMRCRECKCTLAKEKLQENIFCLNVFHILKQFYVVCSEICTG